MNSEDESMVVCDSMTFIPSSDYTNQLVRKISANKLYSLFLPYKIKTFGEEEILGCLKKDGQISHETWNRT
jgi:hypothetical protein